MCSLSNQSAFSIPVCNDYIPGKLHETPDVVSITCQQRPRHQSTLETMDLHLKFRYPFSQTTTRFHYYRYSYFITFPSC